MTCVVLAGAPAAFAAGGALDSSSKLTIRKIDATHGHDVKVTFIYNGSEGDLPNLTIREDGRAVKSLPPVPLAKSGQAVAVVLVVDLSGSMADDGSLARTKEGLHALLADLRPDDQVGIVGFNDDVKVYQELTSDHTAVDQALGQLDSRRKAKTAMWDGVKKGATLLRQSPELQPNIVLATDGLDDVSKTSYDGAAAAVEDAGSSVFAVGLKHNGELDTDRIPKLVNRAGGQMYSATKAADVTSAFAAMSQSLQHQWVVTYTSTATQGQVNLEMTVADEKASASYVAGSVAQGANSVSVRQADKPWGPAFLRSKTGLLAGFLLVGVAVALGIYALATLATRQDNGLQSFLHPYSEGYAAGEDGDANSGALAQTAFLARAVNITEDFAQRQGLLTKVETALERADLPLRAAEAIFFYLAGSVVLALFGLVLGGFLGMLVAFALGLFVPPMVLGFLAKRRSKTFQGQLPDMLSLLSGSLRAGYSLMQGVEAVSQEVTEPMGKELRRVVTESRLGRELEESLDGIAERMGSPDFAWAVMAIRIQREVGGNLAEVLLTVAETMTQRERLRRDVASLTAEGKISAILLGLLPVGLGAAMWSINPDYMGVLFSSGMGQVMLGVAVVAALIGFAWMKKTIQIEI